MYLDLDNEGNCTVDHVRLADEARLAELLRERQILTNQNGAVFYKPHAKQRIFHAMAHHKYRYVRTGNRWGKSQCGSYEDVSMCIGERLCFDEKDPLRYVGIPRRPLKGLVIVQDWGKAEEIFTNQTEGAEKGKIFQFLPKDRFLGIGKNSCGETDKIMIKSRWGGVSTLHFDTVKSYMQNPAGHESSHWDFIHVDEPCPEGMWKAHSRGLMDTGGKAWFLCTPLDHQWINSFFIPSSHEVPEVTKGSVFIAKRFVMIGSSSDNPYIKQEDRDDYAATLSADERACRMDGIPLTMSGMIYKDFKPQEHVWNYEGPPHGWKDNFTPPADYTIRYAIDPHPRTPHAVLFAATAPTGEVFFYHEIFKATMIDGLAEAIIETIGDRHVELAQCDPIAYIESPIDGSTMIDVLESHGLEIEKAPKDLSRGILLTQAALRERMHDGTPRLRFMPHMSEMFFEFDRYVWDPKHPNKPVDKDDHLLECLYRMVIGGLDYVKPPDLREKQYFSQYNPAQPDFSAGMDYTGSDLVATANMTTEQRWDIGLPLR
jgi:hypothetical protein